jgi:hypothetical protein
MTNLVVYDRQHFIEYFSFLDSLREGGTINMFGAGTGTAKEFEITHADAAVIQAGVDGDLSCRRAGRRPCRCVFGKTRKGDVVTDDFEMAHGFGRGGAL